MDEAIQGKSPESAGHTESMGAGTGQQPEPGMGLSSVFNDSAVHQQ